MYLEILDIGIIHLKADFKSNNIGILATLSAPSPRALARA